MKFLSVAVFWVIAVVVSMSPLRAVDEDTRVALLKAQLGSLMSDAEILRIVRFGGIKWPSTTGSLDLPLKVAIYKAEIGHPLTQKDFEWLARNLGRTHPVELEVDVSRRTIRYPLVAHERDFSPIPRVMSLDFPLSTDLNIEPVCVVKVLKQNHSCIFQKRDGSTSIIRYGNGILYVNYAQGNMMLLNRLTKTLTWGKSIGPNNRSD